MDKLFYPKSIVIMGLSKKASNVPRIILENLIRWGYMGRIFGVNPKCPDEHVDGVKMYKTIRDLPIVPDLCVALIPARLIPETIESCGRFGIHYMAVPSGGFTETGEEGEKRRRRKTGPVDAGKSREMGGPLYRPKRPDRGEYGNPVRILADGSGAMALDGRMRIENRPLTGPTLP